MAINITSPVTGGAQTGLTSPTYTVATDIAPDNNGKQVAVTAIGGTQVGVTPNSVSSPFTLTFTRPKSFKSLGKPNPTTGLIANVQNNVYKVIVRKGVTPLAGQPVRNMIVDIAISVPAGADTADIPNVRAALSLAVGALNQQSASLGDTTVNGIL